MVNLTIQHYIHLTKAQRYAIHEGIQLVTVGISVPVWFINKNTSEPAKEVFCRYYLSNPHEDRPINVVSDGYEIALPYREGKPLLNEHGIPLSDEEWRVLNATAPDKLETLYRNRVTEVSSAALLDPPDGIGHMAYREHNRVQQDDNELMIIHYVNITNMEQLTESIV